MSRQRRLAVVLLLNLLFVTALVVVGLPARSPGVLAAAGGYLADAATAGGAAVSGAIILLTGGTYWLDPAVACVIAAIAGCHAARLIQKVIAAIRSSWRPDPGLGSGM